MKTQLDLKAEALEHHLRHILKEGDEIVEHIVKTYLSKKEELEEESMSTWK